MQILAALRVPSTHARPLAQGMPIRTEGLPRQPFRNRTALICTGGLRLWSPHAKCSVPLPPQVQARQDLLRLLVLAAGTSYSKPARPAISPVQQHKDWGVESMGPDLWNQTCAQRPSAVFLVTLPLRLVIPEHNRQALAPALAPANPDVDPAGTIPRLSMQRQKSRTGSTLMLLVRPLGGLPLWQQTTSGDLSQQRPYAQCRLSACSAGCILQA